MDSIDFTQWPVWLAALLLILNLFKTPLGNLFPAILSIFSAKVTSRAQIKEIEAEGERQDEVAEKLMLSSFVQQLLARNQELIDFLQTVVVKGLDTISQGQQAIVQGQQDSDIVLTRMDERLITIAREQKQVQQVCEKIVNGD